VDRFELTEMVKIKVWGDLAHRFLSWSVEEGLAHVQPGSFAAGKLIAYFGKEDASRIRAWFEAQQSDVQT